MKVYIVEDESSIREIEIYTLQQTGFEAEGFGDANAFFKALKQETPDLILLDLMLPGEDGMSVLSYLKKDASYKNIPVIIASAKGNEYDRIKGLDSGADDYLTKPFGMMEMVSRVKAVLRRSNAQDAPVYMMSDITIDDVLHQVKVRDQEIELTKKEYDLLKLLMSHPGRVYSRDQLLNQIWGMDYDGETRTVDVHIRTLRSKLLDKESCIDTVRGIGYRFKGE